jgi:hypothetical protein
MMRRLIRVAILTQVLVTCCLADTIRFKNGTFIHVDKTQDNGGSVDYWIGSTKYTAAKDDIEKIEKDSGPGIRLGPQSEGTITVPANGDRTFSISENVARGPASHFTLSFAGDQPRYALEEAVMNTLQEHYDRVAQALKFRPAENIAVTLYMQREFFDGTQAPAWAGTRDGKLRIPMQGVPNMTPALEHVLKIEVGRAFVYLMVHGRAPAWLDHGLAQMLEPPGSSPFALVLVSQFKQHTEIPFADLEKPFSAMPTGQIKLASAESLAMVQYLNSKYGMDGVLRVAKDIGDGTAPEAALRSVTGSGYVELEGEVAEFVKGRK